ncbi:MAG: right-handed parallel beta-helix repeat-containing protein, partial [Bacteroides sp.]|nr:right-handed parallel beta-helix repeat-containing protein [Bacteroides sp.]
IASVSALTAYATRQSVVDVAKSFNPEKSPIANLGQVFVEWVGEEAFAVDQRGQQRNPDKMQPGAYDAGLN